MEYTASDKFEQWDFDQWLEVTAAEEASKQPHGNKNRGKKRRRPLRKNRKPSRPISYIGQRTNNRLLKICTDKAKKQQPE